MHAPRVCNEAIGQRAVARVVDFGLVGVEMVASRASDGFAGEAELDIVDGEADLNMLEGGDRAVADSEAHGVGAGRGGAPYRSAQGQVKGHTLRPFDQREG